jgi:hypothetical protein
VGKALSSVREALAALDEEILAHQEGRGSVSSPSQLSDLRRTLAAMESQLAEGPLPPRSERLRGAGHAVADSWPYDSSLGPLILTAEQRYLAV